MRTSKRDMIWIAVILLLVIALYKISSKNSIFLEGDNLDRLDSIINVKSNERLARIESIIASNVSAIDAAMADRMQKLESKVLNEVFNLKIEAKTNSFNSSCDYMISSLPYKIVHSGRYCVGQNFDAKNIELAAIKVEADNVTIDGLGHCIAGPADAATILPGVLAINHSYIKITNLCVSGFHTGVLIGGHEEPYSKISLGTSQGESLDVSNYKTELKPTVHSIEITNMHIEGATFQGIHVRADNVKIVDNSVSHTGGTRAIPNAFATGIQVNSNDCIISRNRVFGLYPSGTGEGVGIVLYFGHGCLVSENIVMGTPNVNGFGRTFGTWIRSGNKEIPFVRNNYISNVHYAFGPFGLYMNNVASGVICSMFVDRSKTRKGRSKNIIQDLHNELVPVDDMPACPDDIEIAIERAYKVKSGNAAYAVALAISEYAPVNQLKIQVAWLLVANSLGHLDAKKAIATYNANEKQAKLLSAGKEIASGILSKMGHLQRDSLE